MLQVIGLLLAMSLLVVLAFKNWGMIPASLVAALIIIVTNRMDVWEAFSVNYATALKNFVGTYLLMFFLGATFGNIMGESGAAKSISLKLVEVLGANKAILIIVLSAALLSYGGISLFVCVFAIYPIGVVLFKKADISKELFPACMLFGCATFTMVAVPGTPAISNIIPTNYFGTNAYAAPVLGIIASVLMFVMGYMYLVWANKRLQAKGIGFTASDSDEKILDMKSESSLPNWKVSVIPLIIVIVLIFALKKMIPMFAVVIALTVGVLSALILFWKYLESPMKVVNQSATASIVSILNTAAIVGFGGVVQGSAGFSNIVDFALNLNMSPLVSASIAVNIVAGITASSSGGLTVFMEALGAKYLQMAQTAGITPQILHRICSIASSGLDSLPHSGATVTCIISSGVNHKQAYKYVFVTNCVVPIVALIIVVFLTSIGLITN
ncbi:GntP family permease [Lachnospiraceae bacterium ZAX-1]